MSARIQPIRIKSFVPGSSGSELCRPRTGLKNIGLFNHLRIWIWPDPDFRGAMLGCKPCPVLAIVLLILTHFTGSRNCPSTSLMEIFFHAEQLEPSRRRFRDALPFNLWNVGFVVPGAVDGGAARIGWPSSMNEMCPRPLSKIRSILG